ncbi:hypothetical protein [Derxia gummosa]|uniref:Uncharacterized protein n=1 Tax=Derxia gummosa DSM 723 TaxID=1121388 RepID=A0A8B6X4Z2_9BURK|nr:hypothetical protein [Derxia gummosa]
MSTVLPSRARAPGFLVNAPARLAAGDARAGTAGATATGHPATAGQPAVAGHAPPARRLLAPSLFLPDLRAATAQLLTEGGDERIRPDAFGFNRYGCATLPDPGIVELGSSTASAVSPAGFDAANRLLARLAGRPDSHMAEAERIRRELLALSGADRAEGCEAVLAASGTDVHLIAITLAAGPERAPVRAVMADAGETGSGVPLALGGRHFGATRCRGGMVDKGAPSPLADAIAAPRQIALREADGGARPAGAIDADFEAAVEAVVSQGERCLLVLTDVSKTGLVAPTPDCAARLAERFGARLTVMVDGCQFRLAPATLAGYLGRGFAVAVTGSKFVGGPAFSGALLLPGVAARRLRAMPLDALAGYTGRADWPADWPGARALDGGASHGLLLRWEAALAELRRFRALPAAAIDGFLRDWGQAVAGRIAADPRLESVDVPALARGFADGSGADPASDALAAGLDAHARGADRPPMPAWDARQTIFPVIARGPDGHPLAPAALHALWRQLAGHDDDADATTRAFASLAGGLGGADAARVAAPRLRLGQPVLLGRRDGQPLVALRLCASARLVSDALGQPDGTAAVIAASLVALDRLAELATR